MAGDPNRAPRREEAPPEIPGYEILGFVGRGSSGVVYRARQLAIDREVAIKILHPHLARESRLVRRLQREARTTARLAHPHIVSAVDMGEAGGRWWYAMEYVDGPSLSQRLRAEGRIREREALRLFIPLCEALEHLWEHGVVHRDIKPANILIDRAGGARLADLGLAVTEEDPSITGNGGTLGTPHYISPEQAVDPRKADVRSDIWSFGATLYHALCGRPPFHGESAAEVLSGVLYSKIPDPTEIEPTVSSRITLVLRKCLTRDPTRRYQDPHELLLDLERVRERRAPRVHRRWLDPVLSRRDPARKAALGATLGLLGLLGVLVLMLPRWLGRDDGATPSTSPESGPFEPLAELEARYKSGLGRSAEILAELREVEARVPLRERVRYEELVRAVDGELRRSVREARTALESELDNEIHEGDLAAAWRTFGDELEERFVRDTGYGLSGLGTLGLNLDAWRERLSLNLESATDMAVSELEAWLLDWRRQRMTVVENAIAQQDWEQAFQALHLPPAADICAGFKPKLPSVSQAGLIEDLGGEFRMRSVRLEDEWQVLDRELRDFVVKARAARERQLRERRPRIDAESMLREDFERELFDRHLTREKMPAKLSRAGLEELEASARALREIEDDLLDEDGRTDVSDTNELAEDALRQRDYGRALALWEEARARLTEGPRSRESPTRSELARRTDLRIAEARALDALLERVAERLHALDGTSIELRWGSITYSSVRLVVGPDPRREGFHAAGIDRTLRFAEMPGAQLESFAGLATEAELDPDARLTLAAFRLHDGRASEAQRALFSGPLPTVEPGRALGADLAARIAEALERGELRAGAREAEAKRLISDVLDEEFRRQNPRIARARLARLLEELGDVPTVKQQRSELLRLRAGLEESAPKDVEREFQRAFLPAWSKPSLARVRFGYDFSEGHLGAFESGDWIFDGLGMVLGPPAAIQAWDQLVPERGLRLLLKTPLVPDDFELRLKFEVLGGEAPGRLLWISAGGFQLALGAADLPGTDGSARFLVGTEDDNAFLQRLLAGEGKRPGTILVPRTPPRELFLRAHRRSGRYECTLDDVALADTAGLRAPPSDARALVLRSWGAIRVLNVELEAGR